MIGILAEKPSAKANMSAAFGGPTGTFDGESYVIVNARGHLYEYKEPDEQVNTSLKAKYHSWSPANLPWDENDFRWIREKKGDAASLLSSIQSVLSQCAAGEDADTCQPKNACTGDCASCGGGCH